MLCLENSFRLIFKCLKTSLKVGGDKLFHDFLRSENCRRFSGNLSTGKNNAVFCHNGIYSAVYKALLLLSENNL